MNKGGSCTAASKESRKKADLRGLFFEHRKSTGPLFRRRQRHRFDFGSRRHDRGLPLAPVKIQDRDFADPGHRGAGAPMRSAIPREPAPARDRSIGPTTGKTKTTGRALPVVLEVIMKEKSSPKPPNLSAAAAKLYRINT